MEAALLIVQISAWVCTLVSLSFVLGRIVLTIRKKILNKDHVAIGFFHPYWYINLFVCLNNLDQSLFFYPFLCGLGANGGKKYGIPFSLSFFH